MAAKKHKLIHLAKELQLTVSHVSDMLVKEGFEAPASPNAILAEETYTAILAKYAPQLYKEYLAELAPKKPEPAGDLAEFRREVVEDIMRSAEEPAEAEAPEEDDPEKVRSRTLERLRNLKVIEPAPAPEPQPEPEVQPEAIAAAEPEPVEIPLPVAEEPAPAEGMAETVVTEEPAAVSEPAPAPAPEPEPPAEPEGEPVSAPLAAEAGVVETPVAAEAEGGEAAAAERPSTTGAGRRIVEHGDQDGEKIGLPVFRPGRVLGMHVDTEPARKRTAKPTKTEASAAARPTSPSG